MTGNKQLLITHDKFNEIFSDTASTLMSDWAGDDFKLGLLLTLFACELRIKLEEKFFEEVTENV